MFSNAIVRTPCKAMLAGLTEADMGLPDYDLACEQHQEYITALQECGLQVTVLVRHEKNAACSLCVCMYFTTSICNAITTYIIM